MSRLQCIGVDGEGGCGRRSRGGRETCDKCTFARLTRCLSEMLIAADRLGRRCLGVELVPQYVDVAVRRWQDHVGRAAILERTGDSPISVGGNP